MSETKKDSAFAFLSNSVQVGSTTDCRAVWKKRDELFTIAYNRGKPFKMPATARDIVRKVEPPIPWESC